jgi:four helix bundle protein
MRRSCTSIPANIAEGCGKNSDAELVRFLRIAMGSASELEYHFLLARDLQLLDAPHYERLANEANEVRRMMAVLIHKIKKGQGW